MREAVRSSDLERAREAAGQGDWRQAYDVLIKADARTPLTGADLPLLADVAYAAGQFDATIDAWERAHAQAVSEGDHLSAAAAAVRVALHLLFDTALMAPVRGWAKRAERLLEGYEETPVHAWLAVVRNYERLLSGDFESARQWAWQAIEVGAKCNPAAAAIGRVAAARSLILEGEVQEGLELLNEAAVATVSGELEPLATGIVYCEVICALQAVAQYDLAEEWTAAMERWRRGQPIGSLHGRCRVHRAEVLRLRGFSLEAEREAVVACEELRPYLRRELGWPLSELGRIRLRMGDVDGAEQALREAHEAGWDPQPGLALVQLARGDIALASASIRDALEYPLKVPSKEYPPNTELRRAPLLEAQAEIEVAAGNLDVAREAADELARIAESFESKALCAGASLASGRISLATGDTRGARRDFERAVRLWKEVGAPYETSLARMGLARAHRAEGNEEGAILEFAAARSGFEQVGAVHQAAVAADACGDVRPVELPKANRLPRARLEAPAGSADEHLFVREGDYWSLGYQGHTVRLRDLKGLRYLARLLADPDREFHALELVAGERDTSADSAEGAGQGLDVSSGFNAGPMLDTTAKAAYRRRLSEIDEDIEEARSMQNEERIAQAEGERDWLVRELARSVGLGGRDRAAGSSSERARASVTRAIRQAMARIREFHPGLAEHLDRTVRTGTYCAYLPDPRIALQWTL